SFFGNPDRSQRSKEISFQEDLWVLVEDMECLVMHQETATVRPVLAPTKVTTKNENEPEVSAIFDGQVAGAEIWLNGNFREFMKSTTYDPAVGYPITNDNRDTRLDSETVFDNVTNPLEHDSYDDVHGDEDGTLGSLGGGGEYSTGEIVL
ncbi:hypothetical protein BYT27DRAFT_7094658, partial [Phlegmacium glaucopus]